MGGLVEFLSGRGVQAEKTHYGYDFTQLCLSTFNSDLKSEADSVECLGVGLPGGIAPDAEPDAAADAGREADLWFTAHSAPPLPSVLFGGGGRRGECSPYLAKLTEVPVPLARRLDPAKYVVVDLGGGMMTAILLGTGRKLADKYPAGKVVTLVAWQGEPLLFAGDAESVFLADAGPGVAADGGV